MSCEYMSLVTPEKPQSSLMEEFFLFEDLEKKLQSFSHLLERSTEKEKSHLHRITEQANAIHCLQTENESLKEENEKLTYTLEEYMKNFVCFTENLKRTNALEEENLSLKVQIEENQEEINNRILNLEIEKNQVAKKNAILGQENEKYKKDINGLKESIDKLNNSILENFKQTLTFAKEEKIKTLEKALAKKENEISALKGEIEKVKESYEKTIKQKSLEYELLKMDYQSAIVQNIKGKQGEGKNEKGRKNDKSVPKSERSEISERERSTSKNQTNNTKPFKIITNKSPVPIEESGRKTRGASKRNTATRQAVKDWLEDEEDEDESFFKAENESFNSEDQIEEEKFDDDDDESFDEEEIIPIKKGKRKARETKKKPQPKKVKKNENKELLMVNRNTINYHLFN